MVFQCKVGTMGPKHVKKVSLTIQPHSDFTIRIKQPFTPWLVTTHWFVCLVWQRLFWLGFHHQTCPSLGNGTSGTLKERPLEATFWCGLFWDLNLETLSVKVGTLGHGYTLPFNHSRNHDSRNSQSVMYYRAYVTCDLSFTAALLM